MGKLIEFFNITLDLQFVKLPLWSIFSILGGIIILSLFIAIISASSKSLNKSNALKLDKVNTIIHDIESHQNLVTRTIGGQLPNNLEIIEIPNPAQNDIDLNLIPLVHMDKKVKMQNQCIDLELATPSIDNEKENIFVERLLAYNNLPLSDKLQVNEAQSIDDFQDIFNTQKDLVKKNGIFDEKDDLSSLCSKNLKENQSTTCIDSSEIDCDLQESNENFDQNEEKSISDEILENISQDNQLLEDSCQCNILNSDDTQEQNESESNDLDPSLQDTLEQTENYLNDDQKLSECELEDNALSQNETLFQKDLQYSDGNEQYTSHTEEITLPPKKHLPKATISNPKEQLEDKANTVIIKKITNYKLLNPTISNPDGILVIPLTTQPIDPLRGYFRVLEDKANIIRPYKFQLLTKKGQVLFESDNYKIKPRGKQIDTFRKAITTGSFIYDREQNGSFRFRLVAINGKLCGIGDMYATLLDAEKSALATKKYGLAANYIQDITNA